MPLSVKVAGMNIPIHFRKRSQDNLIGEALGYYDEGESIIVVRKNLSREQQQHTLWHEIVHTAEAACGLDLEEDTVERMARMTYSIIRDNPEIIAWVCGMEFVDETAPQETAKE